MRPCDIMAAKPCPNLARAHALYMRFPLCFHCVLPCASLTFPVFRTQFRHKQASNSIGFAYARLRETDAKPPLASIAQLLHARQRSFERSNDLFTFFLSRVHSCTIRLISLFPMTKNARYGRINFRGRLAQRERRCLTSTRSQVQILYRPPLKSQVRHFLSDLFFFQGNQGKQVPDKLAAIGHARFPPIHRAHKNGRRLTPTPENQRAFTLKARLSNAGKRTHLPFYGPGTHRRPGENPPYAPQARFLHANSKRPPAQPTALKLCDSHVTTRKTPNGYVETCRADALRFIPLARPSRPRASRAHGQAMPPWRRRRAYGRSRRAARRRTTAAGRSGASRRRRLPW